MLDDLKLIQAGDPENALGVAAKQWQQLGYGFGLEFKPEGEIRNVVLAGMGGSALAASFLTSWPQLMVPFEVVRDYELPYYAGTETLFIASSYSGNTEETLSALHEAENRDCQIVVIASGGALAERAEDKLYPLYRLPGDIQPRMAVFYNFAALIQLLSPTGYIGPGRLDELRTAGNWLQDRIDGWLPTVPSHDNQAKSLALAITGKTPIVYAGPKLFPAAYKWKIGFNESAKNLAWCNQYSEFNHNEFIGWTSHPLDKPFAVVEIRSSLEHPRIQKRFAVSERLLEGKRPAPIVVEPRGETLLEQLLWSVTLGDFVGLYLAILNGVDPTPVDLVEKLKRDLNKT